MNTRMIVFLNIAKAEASTMDNDDIKAHIKDQDWDNIYIQDTKEPGKGRGVYTGMHRIKQGTKVCDYHGPIVSKTEGLKRLADYDVPDCNYIFFFEGNEKPDGNLCVDACVKCECHTEEEFRDTKGRLINHARGKEANLKPQARWFNWTNDKGETERRVSVLLIARRDIPPST